MIRCNALSRTMRAYKLVACSSEEWRIHNLSESVYEIDHDCSRRKLSVLPSLEKIKSCLQMSWVLLFYYHVETDSVHKSNTFWKFDRQKRFVRRRKSTVCAPALVKSLKGLWIFGYGKNDNAWLNHQIWSAKTSRGWKNIHFCNALKKLLQNTILSPRAISLDENLHWPLILIWSLLWTKTNLLQYLFTCFGLWGTQKLDFLEANMVLSYNRNSYHYEWNYKDLITKEIVWNISKPDFLYQ